MDTTVRHDGMIEYVRSVLAIACSAPVTVMAAASSARTTAVYPAFFALSTGMQPVMSFFVSCQGAAATRSSTSEVAHAAPEQARSWSGVWCVL